LWSCGEPGKDEVAASEGGALVSPGVVAFVVAALIERGHGLIRRPRLDLHKVRPLVATRWTLRVRRVHVLPSRLAAQNVVHLLQLQKTEILSQIASSSGIRSYLQAGKGLGGDLTPDLRYIGAGVAREAVAISVLLDYQYVSARRAEKQHNFGESEYALFGLI